MRSCSLSSREEDREVNQVFMLPYSVYFSRLTHTRSICEHQNKISDRLYIGVKHVSEDMFTAIPKADAIFMKVQH
ncbi:unnamed protein product [Arabidopsis thaliana]|nr:unnamed protein product [Arabidopsis thaliana]